MVAKPISTAEMSSVVPAIYQRFKIPTTKTNCLLNGIGVAMVLYAAAYDEISLELWSDRDGLPGAKIADSSSVWTKDQIDAQFPLAYSFLYAGFEFAKVPLKKGAFYHVAIRATGYTGDATSFIAWCHAYPDTQYPDGLLFTVETIKAGIMPLVASIFASEF